MDEWFGIIVIALLVGIAAELYNCRSILTKIEWLLRNKR